jgi:hypothetical protein
MNLFSMVIWILFGLSVLNQGSILGGILKQKPGKEI